MRKLLFSAIVIGLVSTLSSAQAQQTAHSANAPRFNVAVVDISYIFKNYPRFTQSMEGLKTDMEAADGQLKASRDQLTQMEEQRNTLKPNSPEFKKIDEDLAREKANFSIKQGTMRRDFLEREAKIYFQTYTEVAGAVKYYAQQNGIGMVLRFNGDPVDPNQREDVMRAIMQPIVHQNNIDITPDVLALLTQSATASRPTAPAR